MLDFLVSKGYRGIILEALALGHVPTGQSGTNPGAFDKKFNWLPAIKNATEKGIFIGITSQSIYGKVNPSIYRNLRLLKDAGGIHLEDMLTETAYAKLGWVLAQTKSNDEAKKLMLTNLAGEFNNRLTDDMFI